MVEPLGSPGEAGAPDGDFTAILASLAEVVATKQTLSGTLQRVINIAGTALEHCSAASVTLVRGGRPTTAVYTERFALELDEAQYEADIGPCLLALRSGTAVYSGDTDQRWPTFAECAGRIGIRNSLSVPLAIGDITLGALNLYSEQAGGLTNDEAAATLLAEHAVIAVSTANAFDNSPT